MRKAFRLVATGKYVRTSMAVPAFEAQNRIRIRIHDLPPMQLGLIWRTGAEEARIRAPATLGGGSPQRSQCR
jgi:hypothetical protein